MLEDKLVIKKLCNDFLMTYVDRTVINNTFKIEYPGLKPTTVIALDTSMTEEELENYLCFILGV